MASTPVIHKNLLILADRLPDGSLAKNLANQFAEIPETDWERVITDTTNQLVEARLGGGTNEATGA